MEYVIPVVLVVLLVAGFAAFLVLNATKKSGPAATADEGAPGIGGDETPLGDTTEHAGEQTEHGTTASDPEAVEERLERERERRPASERLADRER